MAANIAFRMVKGRVIPIKVPLGASGGPNDTALRTAIGGALGLEAGRVAAHYSAQENRDVLRKQMKKNQVKAKKWLNAAGAKNVTHIGSHKEAMNQKHLPKALKSKRFWQNLKDNAFHVQDRKSAKKGKRKSWIVTKGNRVNRDVLGHELGHHRDYVKRGKFGYSAVLGSKYKSEKRAWKESPIPRTKQNRKLRDNALETYRKERDYTRGGLALGSVIGAVTSIAFKKSL